MAKPPERGESFMELIAIGCIFSYLSAVIDPRSTHIVLYDDECPLCTFQMKLLTWLDWRNVLSLLPISEPRTASLAPHLSRDELMEAIHCVSRDGRIYR